MPSRATATPTSGDGVTDRVFPRKGVRPVYVWLTSAFVPLLVFGILAALTGHLGSTPGKIGFVHNYNFFHNVFLGVPAVVTFYYLLPRFFKDCFAALQKNGVLGRSDDSTLDYGQFLGQAQASISRPLWSVLSFVAALLFLKWIAIPQHRRGTDWLVRTWPSFVLVEVMWLIVFTLAILLCVRLVFAIYWINKAFRTFDVRVRPLFPDGVGGLEPLSRFSIRIGYMLFFFGLEMAANVFGSGYARTGVLGSLSWTPDTVVPWLLYLAVAPALFFAPLAAAHDAMKQAKERELVVFADRFDRDYKVLRQVVGSDGDLIAPAKQKIDELRKLHEMVSAFPVWPFQTQKFVQFSAAVLLPLLLVVLSSVAERVVSRYF